MNEIIFEAVEPATYAIRRKSNLNLNLIIAFILFLFIGFVSSWFYGLIISVFFFIIQNNKSSRWEKSFIKLIEINNNIIKIIYNDKNQQKELSGIRQDFKFKKQIAFNRTKTPYLSIYYKDNLVLKQFEIGEWNEKIFDKVIEVFS